MLFSFTGAFRKMASFFRGIPKWDPSGGAGLIKKITRADKWAFHVSGVEGCLLKDSAPAELIPFAGFLDSVSGMEASSVALAAGSTVSDAMSLAKNGSPQWSGEMEKRRRTVFFMAARLSEFNLAARLFITKKPEETAFFLERINAPKPSLDGKTLLSVFVLSRNMEACQALVAMGADPEAPNDDGSTPVSLAVKKAESFGAAIGGASTALGKTEQILSYLQEASIDGQFPECPKRLTDQKHTSV